MRAASLITPLIPVAALVALGGCAAFGPRASAPTMAEPPPPPVVVTAPDPAPIEFIAMAPIPNPPEPERDARIPTREPTDPATRVARANAAARIEPTGNDWSGAVQVFPYQAGALYRVYTAPGRVTDIALEAGETLAGTGPVAAGDTARWIIGDTSSGIGSARQVHILVKPTRAGLETNLVVNTDRRTYRLELVATERTYMAAVEWRHPPTPDLTPAVDDVPASPTYAGPLNYGYLIDGPALAWRPTRAFDDGRQTFIELPEAVAAAELPPLFIAGRRGASELVNYRVAGRLLVVDRLFERAELRLGGRGDERRVRILRSR